MNFGISDKDQTKAKEAVFSLWEVCSNIWDNVVNDKSEEKIKTLEEEIVILKNKSKHLRRKMNDK
tara:strand:- start:2522 stop:2716 length:195 start_codon:yes stop_codon:yes gene_type:complete